MKLAIKVALVFALGMSTAWAIQNAVKRSKYVDENYGYSLELPKFPGAGPTRLSTALIVTGPRGSSVAPSVDVTIYPNSRTVKDYRELMLGHFKQIGLKLNSEKELKVSGKDAVEFDYEGGSLEPGARPLHFLALAVVERERVVVVTCSATPKAFPGLEKEFRACINSLKFP